MNKHTLKTDSQVFQDVWIGNKTYEIRYDDRGYRVGDILELLETTHSGSEMKEGNPLCYTNRSIEAKITHVLKGPIYGLIDGWVILSINSLRNCINKRSLQV